jgi:hypothetical protein
MPYQESTKPPFLLFLSTALLLLLLPFACMAAGPYTETYPRPFNSEAWKAAYRVHGDESRCGMLLDLRSRIGLVGKTEAELSQLLGKPETYDRERNSSDWHLCDSFLDIRILQVKWKDGRAVSAFVYDS